MKKDSLNLLLAKGNSMYPLLLDNDILILNAPEKLQVDDIVVTKKKSFYIAHRIIYINKHRDLILTKGDHNRLPDKAINFFDISGNVQKVFRNGRTLVIENLYLVQSSFYFEEINKINSAFLKHKVTFVFLKGLPVYLHYTKNPPRRIYADCDILIDPYFFKEAESILLKFGYKKDDTSLRPLLVKTLKAKPELSFSKTIKNFIVTFDIHLEAVFLMAQTNNLFPLYSKFHIKKFSKHLLSEKRHVNLRKQIYPLLTVENQILYLALHLFHDNFQGYYKYSLLEAVINSSKFNESLLIQTIKEYKMENFTFPVFKLLKKYYNPKFSVTFLNQIRPKKLRHINQLLRNINIFRTDNRLDGGIKRFRNIYSLSSTHPIAKPLVFLNPDIVLLIIFSISSKLKSTSAILFRRIFSEMPKNY